MKDYAKSVSLQKKPGVKLRLRWVLLLAFFVVVGYGFRTLQHRVIPGRVMPNQNRVTETAAEEKAEVAHISKQTVPPQKSQEADQTETDQPAFDFYTVLPGSDTVVSKQANAEDEGKYALQVSVSHDKAASEQLQQRLMLLGFASDIKTIKDKDDIVHGYRVVVGPYETADEAEADQMRLQENRIDSVLMSGNKKE